MVPTPGRNDPCPCGSGRKFKHCCLARQAGEDSVRVRLRGAEDRVVRTLMEFTARTWDEALIAHAWEDFWVYDGVPDDLPSTPEFETMFVPWLVFGFVPDPEADEAQEDWPTQPIGLEWLAAEDTRISDLDRAFIETACRSPLSAFVVEDVASQRSLDLKDVLTGKRFHALEESASQTLRPGDLLFTRVLTLDGASIMIGGSPFIVPPHWHASIIDWRERAIRRHLPGRQDLEDFDTEIRELYFGIAAALLDPTPPQLTNTDGDPLALITLTYRLHTPVAAAFEKLAPLAKVHGKDHIGEIARDERGAVTSALLSWVKAGNRQQRHWRNTVLGTLRLGSEGLVVEVNSTRRADRVKREIAKRLSGAAMLVDTQVVDPAEALAEGRRDPSSETGDVELPRETVAELRAIEEELQHRYWEQWLDTRVPALGNRTPRQAARSVRGRERLEALLSEFTREIGNSKRGDASPVAFIRDQLGLPKRRF